MGEQDIKLDKFKHVIYREAYKEKQDIFDKTQEKKAEEIKKAHALFQKEADELVETKRLLIKNEYVKLISLKKLDCDHKLLLKRDELVTSFFDNIKEKLLDFTLTDEYKKRLVNIVLVCEENGLLDGSKILIREKDMPTFNEVISILKDKNCEIEISDKVSIGGIIINNENVGIMFDETIDTKLHEEHIAFNSYAQLSIV